MIISLLVYFFLGFIIDYYRLSSDWRMIFGGGETYSGKFLNDAKEFVTNRMYKVFPELKKYKVDYCWGGTLAITINRFPNFGTLSNGKIVYAHGYSGHGIALSTLAGKLITEKIQGCSERFDLFRLMLTGEFSLFVTTASLTTSSIA